MALPETVLTLAGFALAHGAITTSDLRTTDALPPFAIVETNFEKRLVKFDTGRDAESVRRSREALREFAANADGWAFVRPGKMRRGRVQSEVLIIEFKGRGMDRPSIIIQRVRHVAHRHGHRGQRYGQSSEHRRDWEHRRDHDHRSPHAGDNGQPTPPAASVQEPAPSTETTTTTTPPADTTTTTTTTTTTDVQLVSAPELVTGGTVTDSGTVDSGVRTTTQYSLSAVQQGIQAYPDGSTLLTSASTGQ